MWYWTGYSSRSDHYNFEQDRSERCSTEAKKFWRRKKIKEILKKNGKKEKIKVNEWEIKASKKENKKCIYKKNPKYIKKKKRNNISL